MKLAIICILFLFAVVGGHTMNDTVPSTWWEVLGLVAVLVITLWSGNRSIGPDGRIIWNRQGIGKYNAQHMPMAWVNARKRETRTWKAGYDTPTD